MITSTGARDYEVVVHDGTAWPPRPSALVVRWIGPDEPTNMGTFDTWRAHNAVAGAPDTVDDLVEWLIADDITESDGSDIHTWAAETGNNAYQAVVANEPTIRYNAVNSLKALEFVSADVNHMDVAAFLTAATNEYTFMIVCKFDNTVNNNLWTQDITMYSGDVLFGINSNNDSGALKRGSVTAHSTTSEVRTTLRDTATITDTDDYHLWTVQCSYTGNFLKLFLDGTEVDSSTITSAYTITNRGWHIGENSYFNNRRFDGRLAEIAMWERSLTATELSDMHDHFMARYAL